MRCMQVIDQLHRNLGVMSICTFKFYSVWAMCFPSMIMIKCALHLGLARDNLQ